MRKALVLAVLMLVSTIAEGQVTATSKAAVASVEGLTDGIQVYAVKQSKSNKIVTAMSVIERSQVGVRERGGPNRGLEVNAYLKTVGLNPGYAWCMAFQQWSFEKALAKVGAKRGGLVKAAAVRQVFRLTKAHGTLMPSRFAGRWGQLMCFKHGRTQYGHVAFVYGSLENGVVRTIEGNTGPDGGRDGDGVYQKKRPLRGYKSLQTEGFIMFLEEP